MYESFVQTNAIFAPCQSALGVRRPVRSVPRRRCQAWNDDTRDGQKSWRRAPAPARHERRVQSPVKMRAGNNHKICKDKELSSAAPSPEAVPPPVNLVRRSFFAAADGDRPPRREDPDQGGPSDPADPAMTCESVELVKLDSEADAVTQDQVDAEPTRVRSGRSRNAIARLLNRDAPCKVLPSCLRPTPEIASPPSSIVVDMAAQVSSPPGPVMESALEREQGHSESHTQATGTSRMERLASIRRASAASKRVSLTGLSGDASGALITAPSELPGRFALSARVVRCSSERDGSAQALGDPSEQRAWETARGHTRREFVTFEVLHEGVPGQAAVTGVRLRLTGEDTAPSLCRLEHSDKSPDGPFLDPWEFCVPRSHQCLEFSRQFTSISDELAVQSARWWRFHVVDIHGGTKISLPGPVILMASKPAEGLIAEKVNAGIKAYCLVARATTRMQMCQLEDVEISDEDKQLREIAQRVNMAIIDVESVLTRFRQVDVDASGAICRGEFDQLLRQLYQDAGLGDIPDSRLHHDWLQVDTDSSGRVDFEEFLKWYGPYVQRRTKTKTASAWRS